MRLRFGLLALALALLPLSAAEKDKQDKDRVRAKEPTTVTVYGRADTVEAQQVSPERSAGGKIVHSMKNIAVKTWNGVVGFGGWLLNTDDDIPSERDRRSRSEPDRRQK